MLRSLRRSGFGRDDRRLLCLEHVRVGLLVRGRGRRNQQQDNAEHSGGKAFDRPPGESIWFEDPACPPARAALAATGARVVLVPVDAEGIDVTAGLSKSATPRLIYVTPSHQFPLGVTMSVARRMQLLDAARRSDAWILEGDYDGEYRHRTAPVPAMMPPRK